MICYVCCFLCVSLPCAFPLKGILSESSDKIQQGQRYEISFGLCLRRNANVLQGLYLPSGCEVLLFEAFVKTKGCSVVAEGGYKKRNRLFGGGSSRLSVFYYIVYSSEQVFAQRNSRFMRAMLLRFMLFGHSASQA